MARADLPVPDATFTGRTDGGSLAPVGASTRPCCTLAVSSAQRVCLTACFQACLVAGVSSKRSANDLPQPSATGTAIFITSLVHELRGLPRLRSKNHLCDSTEPRLNTNDLADTLNATEYEAIRLRRFSIGRLARWCLGGLALSALGA